ncbi:MAG: hypothetical protein AAF657_14910 [Acidobacteriota bacterium]
MALVRAIRGLAPIDAKSVGRDPLLRWMIVMPVVMALLLRLVVAVVTVRLRERYGFDLEPYYALITSFMSLIGPMMAGVVIGFLLLDQRDDGTLTALQITPVSLQGFLVYRLGVLIVVSILMTMIAVPMVGLVEISPLALLLVAIVAAPLAPIYALILVCFANNKVQGFALMKAVGTLSWPPIIAFFLPSAWQWTMGVVPQFWPVKLFWLLEADAGGILPYVVVGLVYQALLIVLFLRRYERVLQR